MRKIIALIICLVVLISATACGGVRYLDVDAEIFSGNVDASYALAPITSEDDEKLLNNPDRGYFIEVEYDVKKNSTMYTEDNTGPTGDLFYKYELYRDEKPKLARTYLHLYGYKGVDLDAEAINRINQFFEGLRTLGIKCLLTFVYQYDTNGILVDGERKYVGFQGDGQVDKETMFRHIEQLAPVLEANKDVISSVYAGFLGAWGEWSLYDYVEYDTATKKVLLEKIVDMVPDELMVMVRQPSYKTSLILPTDERYDRIGFHNDAIFGCINGSEYGTGDWNPGSPAWTTSVREAAGVPVAGELFWGWWFQNNNFELDGMSVLQQLYEQRFYALSMAHSYREYDPSSDPATRPLYAWKNLEITPEQLDYEQINYAPSWFLDASGNRVTRSLFDFLRDYTGYKLEIREVNVKGKLESLGQLEVGIDLVNYGFAAPFNLESGFAILDEDGNVFSYTLTGDPRSWHNRSADNTTLTLDTHMVSGKLLLPESQGTYSLAFFLRNSMGDYARVGNKIRSVNGYNEIMKFTID